MAILKPQFWNIKTTNSRTFNPRSRPYAGPRSNTLRLPLNPGLNQGARGVAQRCTHTHTHHLGRKCLGPRRGLVGPDARDGQS